MVRDMETLNEEMEAKGVTIFAGGLHPASDAKSLRAQPGGKVLITDGPYLETKEHVGGLTISVLLGTGKRFFAEGTPPRSFELVSTKALASGVIIMYKPNGPLRTGTMGV